MKMIILAAGKGTRLLPLTNTIPKPLAPLPHGKSLLEEHLQQIRGSGVIHRTTLITGYFAEQIAEKIPLWNSPIHPVTAIHNPLFESTNNLISLWTGRELMNEEDFFITNGDNLFEKEVFARIVEATEEGISLAVCKREFYGKDDMKVQLAENGSIVRVSKEIIEGETHGESVGLVAIKGKRMRDVFRRELGALGSSEKHKQSYWLEVFNSLISKGFPIKAVEISADQWWEVDTPEDLERITSRFSYEMERIR